MTRILLIEDEKELLDSLMLLLELKGFDVSGAGTFGEALEKLNEAQYDLILSDVNLPDGNGLGLLDLLRDRGAEIPPFVVISAFGDPVDIKKGLDAGANAYLVKPLAFKSLLAQIEELI